MTPRDYLAEILEANAAGDAKTLARLAVELHALAAPALAKRQAAAERQRRSRSTREQGVTERDVTPESAKERDNANPPFPPPQPPDPHNYNSFPPPYPPQSASRKTAREKFGTTSRSSPGSSPRCARSPNGSRRNPTAMRWAR